MSEGGSHFSDYLSIYSSFITMLSVFLGFILATVTLVCTLPTDLLYRRLTLFALLLSFSLMDWTLIRTHANVLKEFAKRGQRFPCPPYNDELLTFAMTFMSSSISGMLLIGGLTIPEAAVWLAVSIALACYAFIRITDAKRTPQPQGNQTSARLTKPKEPEDIPNAKEVIIELKPLCDMKWVSRKTSEYGKEIFLKSVARRAKEFLLGKLVAEDHIGTFPKEVMWEGASLAWDADYKVLATEPKGEIRITLKTAVICRLEAR